MTPQFTTPCFVSVESDAKRQEVCEKLEQIGYRVFRAINNPSGDMIFTDLFFADGSYTNELTYVIWKKHMVLSQLRNTHIDCSANIDLFLALAGMRSDTDRGQWFVSIYGDWLQSKVDDFWDSAECGFVENWNEATAEEIIEYFKKI